MRCLCSVTWTDYCILSWVSSDVRTNQGIAFSPSPSLTRGEDFVFPFPCRTWQSLVWTSKLPCVSGSHLGHRLPFVVINSDLLCCHEMSLLLSVLGFFNSTDVYPHLFEVFLVKPSVRAKFCSPLAAQSKEAGLQSWSHRLWFGWNRVCRRHGLHFEFAVIRLFTSS